jgi:polygalacturonase
MKNALLPLSRRSLLALGVRSSFCFVVASLFPIRSALALREDEGRDAAALVKSIRIPHFASRSVRVSAEVDPQGADGREVIQRQIDALNRLGGGRVIIPPGTWTIAGPLRLTSNIDLHLEEGAVLLFSDDPDDYLPSVLTRWEGTEVFGYSPFIYAYHAHNVAITGRGTISGNRSSPSSAWGWKDARQQRDLRGAGRDGDPLYDRVYGKRGMLHPSLIQFFGCSSVLVEGISTVDALFWGTHFVYCNDVTVRGLKVDSLGSNNDGVDIDSSYRVLVEKCVFRTGDDCIAIKSGRDRDGRSIGKPSEDIVIRDCIMNESKSAAIALGSEMSGGIRSVFVHRCVMRDVETVVDIKSNLDRGGIIENIRIQDLSVEGSETVLEITTEYHGYAGGNNVPLIRDVRLDDARVTRSERGVVIKGAAQSPVEDVEIDRLRISSCDKPMHVVNAKGISVTRSVVNGQALEYRP